MMKTPADMSDAKEASFIETGLPPMLAEIRGVATAWYCADAFMIGYASKEDADNLIMIHVKVDNMAAGVFMAMRPEQARQMARALEEIATKVEWLA